MGLDLYFYGEKKLSLKSKYERKLIHELNTFPFTTNDIEDLETGYLYTSDWTNPSLCAILNNRQLSGQIGDINGLKRYTDKKGSNHWTIMSTVLSLRKANAIHNWFVQNAQDGIDDCGYYPIDHVLESFIEQSSDVLNGNKKAEETIPTTSGFFFGGTSYDKWYYKELRRARRRFKRLVAKCRKDKWKYFYCSSW